MRRLESLDWWPDLLSAKDELSLRELARKFDVTPGAIAAAIRRTGVSRRPSPPGPKTAGRKALVAAPVQPAVAPTRPPPSRKSDGLAWAVTFADAASPSTPVVIAGSFDEALAEARRVAEPIGLMLLGRVL